MPLPVLEAGLRETASSSRGRRHLRDERGENAAEIPPLRGAMLSL